MDDTIKIAEELKSELDKLPLFIEYKKVKNEIVNSDELNSLKKQIALAKQSNDLETHKALLNKYNSHPLMINYQSLQEEVYEYLKQVSDIVNKK